MRQRAKIARAGRERAFLDVFVTLLTHFERAAISIQTAAWSTSQTCTRSQTGSSRHGIWNAAWRRSPCGCSLTRRGWWRSSPAGVGWPGGNYPMERRGRIIPSKTLLQLLTYVTINDSELHPLMENCRKTREHMTIKTIWEKGTTRFYDLGQQWSIDTKQGSIDTNQYIYLFLLYH